MLFKDISIFSSGSHYVLLRPCKEHFCEKKTVCVILVEGICKIILNLDLWLSRCCLKIFLFLALAAIMFCFSLVRNISVKKKKFGQW